MRSDSSDLESAAAPIVGQTATITKTFTMDDVQAFAELSLDKNPVHLDTEYASDTIFRKPIVHGLFVGSLISAVLANKLPGPGSIYLEQNLRFKAPVFIGDTVTAEVAITEFIKPHIIRCRTTCSKQDGQVVIEGEAVIRLPDGMKQ